ncbi:MAG: DUF359 domain-containing protein [archaeon]|nr:DUF359 domain-containing protein [archaeon]
MEFKFKFKKDTDYSITEKARKLVAKPIDFLMEGTIEENIMKSPQWFKENNLGPTEDYKILCVGDVVTEAFVNNEMLAQHLQMCIIDGITKRKKYDNISDEIFTEKIIIENPAGTVQGNVALKLKKILESDKNKKTLIFIKGEEDLLVIPLVLFAEENTFVVYGQPPITDFGTKIPAGMVIITVNSKRKMEIMEIMQQFKMKKI